MINKTKVRVYIAGGWFDLLQMRAVQDIESVLTLSGGDFFSPRKMNLGTDGCDWDAIYKANIAEINKCDVVIASTEGKDMGTLFECGVAATLNKKIVYYAPSLEGGRFNLMLARSASSVCTSMSELVDIVNAGYPTREYKGGIE